MPKSLPLYSSFSSGEITPRLTARADIEAYKNGCTRLENMISTSHGPVITRHGGKMIGWDQPKVPAVPKAVDGRLFKFSVTKSLGTFVAVLLLEDGTTTIRPYAPNGRVIPPSIELVTNPNFEQGATGWTDISVGTGKASFISGTCTLEPGVQNTPINYASTWTNVNGVPVAGECNATATTLQVAKADDGGAVFTNPLMWLVAGNPIRVQEVGSTTRYFDYTVSGTVTDNGVYYTVPVTLNDTNQDVRNNQLSDVTFTSTNPAINTSGIRQEITGTVNGNNLTLHVQFANNDDLVTINVGSALGLSDIYSITTLSKDVEVEFNNTGTTSVWLDVIVAEDSANRTINSISVYDSTLTAPQDIDVVFVGPWTSADLPELQADSPPAGDVLYISSSFTPVQKLTYTEATNAWTFEAVPFTDPPAEWVAGNYPRAITFYQGRMWLGGTPTERERFWASKSADIEVFTQGALDDDGLEFTISEQGQIEWVTGARNLIIGTATGEHIVESAGGVITPSDIEIKQQSAYGSRAVQAEKIGQKILYVSPDGRKVREIGYQWTDDGWISRDISFASEHITEDNEITEIAFAQNPENLLWCRTKKGGLVCCTYEKTYNVIGWHRHNTKGKYLSIASVDINGDSYLGALVLRTVNGDERMFFETFDPTEDYVQDSWKYYFSDIPTAVVTGAEHLAGQTVSVLTDSGTHPDITINANGVGYLQSEHNEVLLGYGYSAKLVTLSTEVIGNEGATYAMNKSWNKIYVRILNSIKPIINGVRPAERLPSTPMDTPELPRDEDVQVADLGWKNNNLITVEQDLPLPLTIVGIFGEQQRENL